MERMNFSANLQTEFIAFFHKSNQSFPAQATEKYSSFCRRGDL